MRVTENSCSEGCSYLSHAISDNIFFQKLTFYLEALKLNKNPTLMLIFASRLNKIKKFVIVNIQNQISQNENLKNVKINKTSFKLIEVLLRSTVDFPLFNLKK